MGKQSQRSVAVLIAMVVLCVCMAGQVNAARPAPAPYRRGYEPVSAPNYEAPAWSPSVQAPEGNPLTAPVVASPAYAPASGPGAAEGPSWANAPVPTAVSGR